LRRLTGILAAAVVLRMAFHALYLPAYEGPDEPQHLARVLAFARKPIGEVMAGRWVDADVVGSVLSYPCPHPEYGCRPYPGSRAAFNLLRAAPARPERPVDPILNQEVKQPPLFYAAVGLGLRAIGAGENPAATLLAVRLFNVMLVALALFGPLRTLFQGSPGVARAGLVALLAPGACEAFARCSNDAAIFFWASFVLVALDRRLPGAAMSVLLTLGPLLKLTALPVSAYAVGVLLFQKRTRAALAGAIASVASLPLRGIHAWGLAVGPEILAGRSGISDSAGEWIRGIARSAYGVVRAPFWAGGWHNFRAPSVLVALYASLLGGTMLAARRLRSRRLLPLAAGVLVAIAGTIAYGVSIRRSHGVWGGLAAWYAWEWAPWLAAAAKDLAVIDRRFARVLFAAECLFVLAANAWWFAVAGAVYAG
jgi:hypothetical protein